MAAYWITYDFSDPDNFEYFYKWLVSWPDVVKECGINTVFIKYDGTIEELEASLCDEVGTIENERVYVVFRNEHGGIIGKFLFGKRKLNNPWDIYAMVSEAEDDQ